MRLLEILLLSCLLLSLLTHLFAKMKKIMIFRYLPFFTIIIIPLHLLVEGYRWQMVPAFAFALVLAIVAVIDLLQKPRKERLVEKKFIRTIGLVLGCILMIVAIIFPLLLPIVDLPVPNGQYDVGTTSFRLVDESREEIFTEESGDVRNILIQAWYPGVVEAGMKPTSYWDKARIIGREYSINAEIAEFWYTHLSLVKTNSYAGIPVLPAEDTYPVIIYSHSFLGLNTENTMMMEELASNGYVVFSIGHTYEHNVTLFTDGEIATDRYEYITSIFDDHWEDEKQLYQDFDASNDEAEKRNILRQILSVDEVSNQLMKVRTADTIFLLNELEKMNQEEGMFQSRLDLKNIGMTGWSFGGGTTLNACLADERLKAGINIDGWPYGNSFSNDESIQQPFMMIQSETEDHSDALIGEMVYEKISNDAFRMEIAGIWHSNYFDFPLFFDIYKYLGYWSTMDPIHLAEITDAYMLDFFGHYLKGESLDVLMGASADYPEVILESRLP